MAVEDRVRNVFKIEKESLYARNGGVSDPEGMNDVWLYLAGKFKMRVRDIKDIVNKDKPHFGGWE